MPSAPGYLVAITLTPPKVALMPLPVSHLPETTRLSLWFLLVPGSKRLAVAPPKAPSSMRLPSAPTTGQVFDGPAGDFLVVLGGRRVDRVDQHEGGGLARRFAVGREGDVEGADEGVVLGRRLGEVGFAQRIDLEGFGYRQDGVAARFADHHQRHRVESSR